VARLVAAGLTNGGIAQQLIISKRTVESHMSSLYRKLGVENRVALARAVLSEGASPSSTCV
jgi:DNA-binding NarL/FixJ family response regulator